MNNDSLSIGGRQSSTGETDPRPSNTGVTGKSFAYSIDWLSYSFSIENLPFYDAHTGEIGYPQGFIPGHELFSVVRPVRPFAGYTQAGELGAGRVDWHHENLKQGGLVTLSGRDCLRARESGVNFDNLLFHALSSGRNVTRLDFAVDVFLPGVNPQDIETAWIDQRVKTSAKTAHPWPEYGKDGKLTGYTFYIGAGSSDAMLRVYNKAAREKVPGDWVRIELQTRGKRAVALAKTMLSNGIISGGKAFLREFVQVDNVAWFNEACSGSDGEFLVAVERKETDRQRWYREQILPAMQEDLARGDAWLAMRLQGLVDFSQGVEQHGGVRVTVPLENQGRKAFYGVQALVAAGFVGPEFRQAFEAAGKEFIVSLLERLGYEWDTKSQRWSLAGVVVPLAGAVDSSAGAARRQASEHPTIKAHKARVDSINSALNEWNKGVG